MRWYAALVVPLLATLSSPAAVERGAIMGAVVDADGTPLTGATVYLIIEKGGCPSGGNLSPYSEEFIAFCRQ